MRRDDGSQLVAEHHLCRVESIFSEGIPELQHPLGESFRRHVAGRRNFGYEILHGRHRRLGMPVALGVARGRIAPNDSNCVTWTGKHVPQIEGRCRTEVLPGRRDW